MFRVRAHGTAIGLELRGPTVQWAGLGGGIVGSTTSLPSWLLQGTPQPRCSSGITAKEELKEVV